MQVIFTSFKINNIKYHVSCKLHRIIRQYIPELAITIKLNEKGILIGKSDIDTTKEKSEKEIIIPITNGRNGILNETQNQNQSQQ